jgi:serine-type D-Ala-D-Ala carboxypeptidase/endopeptidase (penicillin-binding protein 4)
MGVSSSALDENAPLPANLPPVIAQSIRAAGLPGSAISFYAQEVNTRTASLSVNAETAMNPASVMKLVTTYAGLELLGPAFTWKTGLYTTGQLQGDVLVGDLILKGGGDPKFTHEQFWSMLRVLRAKGIREVRGSLLLDRGYFEPGAVDPGKFDGEPIRAYNAQPDALLINFKSITLNIYKDPAKGNFNVVAEPKLAGFEVSNSIALGAGECRPRGRVIPQLTQNGVSLSGSYPPQCGDAALYIHPYAMSHSQYAGALFRQLWADLGGTFAGEVKDGATPPNAVLLAETESESMAEAARGVNKFSNNVMARMVYLSLSADIMKIGGSPDRSQRVVKSWLEGKGIAMPELVIENGSGLSRIERVSAQGLGRMLVAAFRSPVMPEFMSSMPLAGFDGTMRSRLKTKDVRGQAHVKTGSLNNVSSIAGYVLTASGKRYAVVCLVNHGNAGRAQPIHDAFLNWVYANG